MTDPVDVVGREDKLERLRAFVASSGASALVLEGEPGIGKTTLWQEAAAAAGSLGHTILTARASSSEVAMGFAGLADLLSEHIDGVVDELPAPQASALDVALLRRVAGAGGSSEVHGASAGCLGVLRALVERAPVLVAIDDLQWLDRETVAALTFAFRRLDGVPIRLAATLRTGLPASPGSRLTDAFPPDRVERIPLGPLSLQALHVVISQHAGLVLPRPVLRRITEISGGNPFFALELARTVAASGEERSATSLRLSPRLEDLVRVRLKRLPTRVLRTLEPAALVPTPTVSLLRSMSSEASHSDADLERAAAAGVVSIQGEIVHFTHPTLAEGLAGMIGPLRQRALHARLAASIEEPEGRARHLAAATITPNAEVATQIEEGANAAASRGAPGAHAELMEFAARLTPAEQSKDRWRRKVAAAYAFEVDGMIARANKLIEECLSESMTDVARSDALVVRAAIRCWSDNLAEAWEAFDEAASLVPGDDPRMSVIQCRRAPLHLIRTCDISGALEFARAAVDSARRAGDDRLLVPALAFFSLLESFGGRITDGLLESAVDLENRLPQPFFYWESPTFVLALRLLMADRLDQARSLFKESNRRCEEFGQDDWSAATMALLVELEVRAGNFTLAGALADEMWTRRQQRGEEVPGGSGLYRKALVLAHLGPAEEARSAIERGIEISVSVGDEQYRMRNLELLGFVELSLGNAARADEALRPIPRWLIERGWNEPSYFSVWPNAIEALVGVGELSLASEYLGLFDERARRCDCPWALATVRRCEGLLRAAAGDLEGALAAFAAALRKHARVPSRFELGRTLMSEGVVLRRALRRGEARRALEEAVRIFGDLATPIWAERARAELARIGGRTTAGDRLTPTERQVAALVALGKTNREAAAELFITVRSVESNLSRIYAKLGVRSRTELAGRLARIS